MDLVQLLNLLTPEQLEEIARIKRQETSGKDSIPKAKKQGQKKKQIKVVESEIIESEIVEQEQKEPAQQDSNLILPTNGIDHKPRKPRKKIRLPGDTQHSKIPNKNFGRREPTKLGHRPNTFATSATAKEHKDDIEVDKILAKNRIPREVHTKPRTDFIEATCSRCQCLYEDVANSLCYLDEGVPTFICEECVRGMK